MKTVITTSDIEVLRVCFEPCSGYRDDPAAEGLCTCCGWPAEEHPDEDLAEAA